MDISSIGSQASITSLDSLSGTNSMQGVYKGRTISSGNAMLINDISMHHDFSTTSLTARKTAIPH